MSAYRVLGFIVTWMFGIDIIGVTFRWRETIDGA